MIYGNEEVTIFYLNDETVTITIGLTNVKTTTVTSMGELPRQVLW